MGPLAAAAVVHALMAPDQCEPHDADQDFAGHSELAITHCPYDEETIRELVAAMADVVVRELPATRNSGHASRSYRTYRGWLPSGLRVDVWTDADAVPDVTANDPHEAGQLAVDGG